MKKYIALRIRNISDAKAAFRRHSAIVIDSSVDKKDPALKNLAEGLHERGLAYGIGGCRVIWLVIDDARDVKFYQQFNEVEIAFSHEWLEERKSKVRYLSGLDYCEAANSWADELVIKPQDRLVEYSVPVEMVA